MLTARRDEPDRIRGLSIGADDYLTKPFQAGVLAARVRALMRRGGARSPETLTIGLRMAGDAIDDRHEGPLEWRVVVSDEVEGSQLVDGPTHHVDQDLRGQECRQEVGRDVVPQALRGAREQVRLR